MKNYIKPEVKVYKVRIESLLSGSGSKAGGQIDCGWAPKRDYSLFDEENDDGYTGSGGLWDDEDFED
ncbi:toxin PIN [Leyella stercorea]|uniref:toxin PIN n=1 Tax=Leyella stercorea TaxID=363265 RepID=UPI00242D7FF7|nr:toxin PIN [Leyella stercorea]